MTRRQLTSLALKVLGLVLAGDALGRIPRSLGWFRGFTVIGVAGLAPLAGELLILVAAVALVRRTDVLVQRMAPWDPDKGNGAGAEQERRLFRLAAPLVGLYLVASGIPATLGGLRPGLFELAAAFGISGAVTNRQATELWAAVLPALYGLSLLLLPRLVARWAYEGTGAERCTDVSHPGPRVVPGGGPGAGSPR